MAAGGSGGGNCARPLLLPRQELDHVPAPACIVLKGDAHFAIQVVAGRSRDLDKGRGRRGQQAGRVAGAGGGHDM